MTTHIKLDKQALLDFLNHDLMLNRTAQETIDEHTDLIDAGVIDSLSLIQLITHLEKKVAITIEDEDVNPDNFQTVNAILNYLDSRYQK